MDCGLAGSSVYGILQAGTLESVAMPSSRKSSQPRNQTQISCLAGGFFIIWATRGSPSSLVAISFLYLWLYFLNYENSVRRLKTHLSILPPHMEETNEEFPAREQSGQNELPKHTSWPSGPSTWLGSWSPIRPAVPSGSEPANPFLSWGSVMGFSVFLMKY